MQTQFAFLPRAANQATPATQVSGAVTAVVTNVTIPSPVETECTIRIVNDGTQAFAWCFGAGAGLTLNNGVYMLPSTVETFTLPAGVTEFKRGERINAVATVMNDQASLKAEQAMAAAR